MSIVLFGLERAMPNIPWPPRKQPTPKLRSRKNWVQVTMPVTVYGKPSSIEAMHLRGSVWAVNPMIQDVGYATSLVKTGFRLSYRGAVFAKCHDAMRFVEQLNESAVDWEAVQTRGFFEEALNVFRPLIEQAEQRGEILLDRVYPS